MQAELAAVSKENKKLVEAKNSLDRVARERASATEKIEKSIDVFKSKAAAAAAAAAAADAKSKQCLQAQADMQLALAEAKKEAAAAKAESAAATKKLEALDRKRALGDSDFAILETDAMDDNPEALKHKCGRCSNLSHTAMFQMSPAGWRFFSARVRRTASAQRGRSKKSKPVRRRRCATRCTPALHIASATIT